MNRSIVKTSLLVLIPVLIHSGCTREVVDRKAVKIIFDSDFGPDYDDVGALAFLHAMADSGKADILATMASNKYELAGPGMDVLNTYFGRPDLPMGAPRGEGVNLDAWQHWPDSLVASYPHCFKTTGDLPDAVSVYRKILNAQEDTSVTIVTVGFLTNLKDLLLSGPDSVSSLNGKDLVLKKVKKLVSMAGGFPKGHEYNVHMDSAASQYVFLNWPTPVIFTGFEIGANIHTGLRVMNMKVNRNPVKDVFRIAIPMAEEDKNGRMSWDETAVLIAVYGTRGFFHTIRGRIIVNPDGSNEWTTDPSGNHSYVKQQMPAEQMARFIEDRMMHIPAHQTMNK